MKSSKNLVKYFKLERKKKPCKLKNLLYSFKRSFQLKNKKIRVKCISTKLELIVFDATGNVQYEVFSLLKYFMNQNFQTRNLLIKLCVAFTDYKCIIFCSFI